MSDKHEPPRGCRLRRLLFGSSPSAILTRCTLGLWTSRPECKGCEANAHEAWLENFKKGLEEGARQTNGKRKHKKM